MTFIQENYQNGPLTVEPRNAELLKCEIWHTEVHNCTVINSWGGDLSSFSLSKRTTVY